MQEKHVHPGPLSRPVSSAPNPILWAAIFLLWILVYAPGLFRPGLLDDADATHAEAAREMTATGDYVTLHVNGIRYLEKAPLPYWLAALSFSGFGVTELATRLPTILAVLLSILLASLWALHAFGGRAGVYGGLFVCTCVGFYLFTRVLIPEALLSLLIGSSLYFFLTALEPDRGTAWRWYAGYASVGLAVLTKGLVALVFVGLIAAGYLALSGEWRSWRRFRLGTGLGVLLLVAAPWHILAGIRNEGFFWFYFVNEHFLRFLGLRFPRDYNKLPALAYWGLHFVWLFPWILYLPLALREVGRDLFPARDSSAHGGLTFRARTRLLCWVWAGVMLVFFAFSTNQEYYTFPAYLPLLILLAGAVAQEEEDKPSSRWMVWANGIYFAVCGVAGAALCAALWASRELPFIDDIGAVLTQQNVANYTLSMSHFFDLSTASFAALRLPGVLAAAALLPGSLFALWLRLRRKNAAATWTMACATALFLVAAQLALVRFGPYLSSKRLAEVIARIAKPEDKVMIYGDQAFGSSLLFYLQRPIYLVNGRTTSMWFGSRFPDTPHIFLDDAELARAWTDRGRIFLFVPPNQSGRAEQVMPQPRYIIAESSGKAIYSNRR